MSKVYDVTLPYERNQFREVSLEINDVTAA